MRSERGTALIEAALVLPVLLLVAVAIFEFGRAYQTWEVMTNAVREGARVATLPAPASSAAKQRVLDYLTVGGLTSCGASCVTVATTTVDMGAAGTAAATKITLNYPFSFIVLQPVANLVVNGTLLGTPITLTAVSVMRNES